MKIVILNTECANLSSLVYSVKKIGFNPIISNNVKTIINSDKLFIPGVGSALTIMKFLKKFKLFSLIRSYTNPVLGICLGMQSLCSTSEENNTTKMLDIINVEVKKIKKTKNFPLPHIGWNKIYFKSNSKLFKKIKNGSFFYFLHSYHVPICSYTTSKVWNGSVFSSSIEKKNFFGVQFHPEKSGIEGQKVIKNFLEL